MQHKKAETFRQIELYIESYYRKNGIVPTNIEISKGTKLSTATVSRYITKMHEEGIVTVNGHRSVKTKSMEKMSTEISEIPIIENTAQVLDSVDKSITEFMSFPKRWAPQKDCFFVYAKDNAMSKVGINKNDLVLIEKEDSYTNEEVVLVISKGKELIRRLRFENNGVRLCSESTRYKDILLKEYVILGTAKLVIKRIV